MARGDVGEGLSSTRCVVDPPVDFMKFRKPDPHAATGIHPTQ